MASRPDETSRLHQALIDLCFERGFQGLEPADLLDRAGVDRTAFERRFDDLEDCFFSAFAAAVERYLREEAPRFGSLTPWCERVRATLYALYRLLAADERLAHFLVVESRLAGERAQLFAGQQLESLFDLIDEGREELDDPGSLSRATAESVGGGVFNQVYAVLGLGEELPEEGEIVPELLYCVVLPYLGPERAAEELHATPPPRRPGIRPAAAGAASLGPWRAPAERGEGGTLEPISARFPGAITGSRASR